MNLAKRLLLFASFPAALVLQTLLPASAPAQSARTRLPEHRLGPLTPGVTTEKATVEKLGPGLQFPGNHAKGRCWADTEVMLCALFSKGKLFALSLEEGMKLPPQAIDFLRGPDGKKPLPHGSELQRKLESILFLSRLRTESGIKIGTTEREILSTMGGPGRLIGTSPPFKFVYNSRKQSDPKCPNYCMAAFTLSRERVVTIFLSTEP